MKNGTLKKSLSVFLAILMIVPTLFATGAPGLLSLFDGVVTEAEAAIAGIRIVVPETLYLTPSTGASTSVQYYINNNADGSVKTSADSTASVHISYPGAKLTSISAKTSADITLPTSITGLVGTTFGSSAATATGTFSLPAGLSAGGTALVEWTFVFQVNGKTRTHYAYSVAYAPWYQPVGAAAKAKGAWHNTFASSILWVSGVHGYADGDSNSRWYIQTANFIPMLGTIKAPGNNNPDTNWIQSGSNGLSPTINYQGVEAGGVKYHARANSISPTANLTVDTSRYDNFNQIPNFSVGFMITDREGTNDSGSNQWYISDFTGQTSSYYNGTDTGSSQYTGDWNSSGTKLLEGSDRNTGVKHNGTWDKKITGTASFRIKSAVESMYKATITSTGWNNNFVNISVTGADKAALREAVIRGTSYPAEHYGTEKWEAYKTALKAAATNLCNPAASNTDIANLEKAEEALKVHLLFGENLIDFGKWNKVAGNGVVSDVTDNGFTIKCNAGAGEATSTSPFFDVAPGKSYRIDMDFIGAGCDVYIFFCDANGNWIDFADGPSNRYSDTTTWGSTFTAPNKAEVVKAQIRVDSNGANNVVRFENIRVYEVVDDATAVDYSNALSRKQVFLDETYGDLPVPTREGYYCVGWFDANGKEYKATDEVTITEDTQVFPKWQPIYTVYFDGNGHDGGSTGEQQMIYSIAANLNANGYTKTGHTFKYWTTNKDGTGTKYTDKANVINLCSASGDTITLYAQWEPNKHTVKFVNDAGQEVSSATYAYGTPAADIVVPANTAPTAYESTENHYVYNWQTVQTVTGDATYYEVKSDEAHTVTTTVTPPTCSKQGFTTYYCDVCKGSYDDNYTDKIPHTPGEVVVENENAATCTATGSYDNVTYCTVCGAEASRETVTTDMIPHNYVKTEHAPTCELAGFNVYVCSACNDTYSEETGSALGHDFTVFVENNPEATCTTPGTKHIKCSRCSEVTTEAIKALGHSMRFIPGTAATCTAAGTIDHYKCSRCNGLFADAAGNTALTEEDIIDPIKTHTPAEKVNENEVDATCTTTGSHDEVVYCTECGYEISRTTVVDTVIAHTAAAAVEEGRVESTCTEAGYYYNVVKCTVCSKELDRTKVDLELAAHTEGETVVENATPETCTENGTYDNVVYCTECGEELSRATVTVDATGHTDGEVVVENNVAPKCETDGSYDNVTYCTICGEETSRNTVTVDALGHTEAAAVEENRNASTCTVAGSYESVVYCSVCDKELSRETVDLPLADHTEATREEVTLDATCGAEGKKKVITYCTVCNAVISSVEATISATGEHSYDAGVVTTKPKCEVPGVKTFTCTVCGHSYTEVVEKLGHDYVGVETKAPTCTETGVMTYTCQNDSSHTYTAEIKENGHTITKVNAKAATCEDFGWNAYEYCSVCDYTTYKQINALGHDYEGVVTTEPTCTEKGVMTYTCKNDASHTYTKPVDALNHIDENNDGYCDRATCNELICDHVGQETKITDAKSATCTEDGYTGDVRCTKCDVIVEYGTKINMLGHEWSATYTSNGDGKDNTHYQTCTRENCGVKSDAVAHDWNDGEITTDPTCEGKGVMTFTCTADSCGATYTEEIKANGHSYVGVVTDPTCEAEGYTTYTCSVCSDSYVADKVSATGHKYVGVVTKNPTCEGKGEKTYTCQNDSSHTYKEEIAANGHKYGEWISEIPATCMAEGTLGHYTCSVCSVNFDADKNVLADLTISINSNAHAWGDWAVTTVAGCHQMGIETRICAHNADHTDTKETGYDANNHINNANHDAVKETCTTVGYTAGVYCTDCKAYISGHEKIDAINHKNKVHHEAEAATCVAEGAIEYWSCPDCSKNFSDEACTTVVTDLTIGIDTNNHDLKTTAAKAPTCTEIGWDEYVTCQREGCNYTTYAEKPATDHAYGAWTFDADGKHKRVCANDANHVETEACADSVTDNDCNCDKCSNLVAHSYGDATCDAPATCTVCGTTTGGALGHDFSVFVETVDYTCTTDGYTTYKCSRCTETENREIIKAACRPAADFAVIEKASCDKAGYKAILCTKCNAELETETIAKREHNLVDTTVALASTCSATGIMNQKCDCAETAEYEACAYTTTRVMDKVADAHKAEADYTVMQKATCEADGYKAILCEYCDAELSKETIAKREHNLIDTTVALAPTCSATGIMNQKCDCAETAEYAACDYTTTREIAIDADAHKAEADYIQTVAPTCSAVGEEKLYCEYCEAVLDTREVAIDADAHKAEADYTVIEKASCDKDGYKAILCEYCDAELKTETIAKLGHAYVGVVTTEPGCETEGVKTFTCSNDASHVYTEAIASLGHTEVTDNAVAPTCTETGLTEGKHCSVCDKVIVAQKVVDALGHTAADAVKENVVAATCDADGSYDNVVRCAVCKVVLESEHVVEEKLGHDYKLADLIRPSKAADGTWGNGYATYVCQNDANHYYSELVSRADYTEYDKLISDLEARLEDETLSDEVRAEIEELLAANKVEADRIESEQDAVNAVVGALTEGSTNYMKTFKVTFVADGEVVSEQTVLYGSAAETPADPEKEGFLFTGWDGKYTNVQADVVINATYFEGAVVIKLDAESVKLAVGESTQIAYTVFPEDSDVELTWTSANTSIATVDADGVVKGIKNGTTTVTVSALNGAISETVVVYVYKENAEYTVQLTKSSFGNYVINGYTFYDSAYVNVKAGQEFKFQFALNSKYNPEDVIVTVNGKDLSIGEDNCFTVDCMTENLTIIVIAAPGSGLEGGDSSDDDNTGSNSTAHSCWCHSSNKLLQFLWKILMFLCKLFGIDSYHYCACGKAHW